MTDKDIPLFHHTDDRLDCTDEWREWINFRDGLSATPNGKLLVISPFGYADHELGKPGTIAQQRRRAMLKLQQRLAA